MTQTITLSGDYQYDSWKIDNLTNAVINAYKAEWTLANIGNNTNPYPVSVRDSGTVTIAGGTIVGEVSLTLDWKDAYVNSAAVMARDVANVTIQDWTISRAWDGIRLSGNSNDTFTIDNVWLTNIRDDGIENDYGQSGTVKDSLFDGVFVGISLASTETGNQTDHVVTLDNVLIRMKSFLYQGEVTHQSIFKTEVDKSPGLNIHDCVFAIEDVNHHGTSRLEIAWDSVISASNNYFLNLSDTPLPKDYPMPPAGFTVLQGAAARAYWESARADWIGVHNGTIGTSSDDTLAGGSSDESIFGYQGKDNISGNGGDDRIFGHVGNDTLSGGGGDDTIGGGAGDDLLFGNAGADTFLFMSGGADRVRHYQVGIDSLSISAATTNGITDAALLVATYASVTSAGVLFDFGHGDTILLSGLGSLAGLAGDLSFV